MFARTQRLLLRPGWGDDAAELAAAIGDPAILRNLATAPSPYGLADAARFLALDHEPLRPNFLLFLRNGASPRLVGGCAILSAPEDGHPELGYWIARPYWGLGLATEAGRQLIEIGRAIGLPPLRAAHFADNRASGAVLRKLGFRPTGQVKPRFSLARGASVPSLMFDHQPDAQAVAPVAARSRISPDEDMRESFRLRAA